MNGRDILKAIYLNVRKAILTFVGLCLFPREAKGDERAAIQTILFIRIDRIGDLVLSTPAFRAIKECFPDAKLSVLASQANYSLLENNPYVSKIFVYNRRQGLKEKIQLIRRLRDCHFDLVIDPYPDYELRTAVIAFLSGARRRLGYASWGREIFFNLEAPEVMVGQHFIDLTLNILKPFGVVAKDKVPEIFLTDDEKAWAKKWVMEQGMGTKPVIGIHPGAHYESQRWPSESFVALIDQLADQTIYLILFGGPGDAGLVKHISSKVNQEVITFTDSSLRRFAALLSCCNVLICNNSGPLHIAVAMNIPTISFMGPTDKNRWMPVGEIHKVFRVDDLPCIGCNLGSCKMGTHDCMCQITPSMVLSATEGLLIGQPIYNG